MPIRQTGPQLLAVVFLLYALLSGKSGAVGNAGPAGKDAHVHVAVAANLEWQRMAFPEGAEWAKVYGEGLGLVRWPPGTSLPTHVRESGWHGIVLSGTLVVTVDGHPAQRLGRLAYFSLRAVPFSVKCEDGSPCVYFAFDTSEEYLGEVDPNQFDVNRTTAATAGDSEEPGFRLIDLKTAKWVAVPNAPGVRRARDWATALRARLNFVFPYWLDRGAELPPAETEDTAVFVVSGVLALRVGDGAEQQLGPGSFFRISGDVSYSGSCAGKECVLLSTDPPPNWKGAPHHVLFPS